MAKGTLFLLALIMIAATVVNCTRTNKHEHEHNQHRREQAQMQKVLEEHSKTVGMGLTGRLASGYPGPAAASKVFPSVHEHVSGHKPCRQGGLC